MTFPKEDQQPMTHDPREAQHAVERIILRRIYERRIEGYTIETAKEIVEALTASPGEQKPPLAAGWNDNQLQLIIERALLDDEYFGNRAAGEDQLEAQARGSAALIVESLRREAPAPEGVVSVELLNIERATGDRLRSENDKLRATIASLSPSTSRPDAGGGVREAFVSVLASLAAAISLLERMPKAKKAAPSDTMFAIMLDDYRKALETGRAALSTPPAAVESNASVEARLREALVELVSRSQAARDHIGSSSTLDNDGNDRFIKIAGIVEPLEHAIGAATTALSPVGDKAKKSEGIQSAYGEYTPITVRASTTLSSPTADRREIVARELMEKWPGDYAWGDATLEPNELAFETADAILAALDGGR